MPSRHSRSSTDSTTETTTQTKTPILINIYDLLPPSRLSTLLWHLGSSLHHSAVVLPVHSGSAREYAYGGHPHPSLTGVYHTPPLTPPPHSTHRATILFAHTTLSLSEIEVVVKDVSAEFLGAEYNLLTRNCNHFTAALVKRLSGRKAPGWLNRAAGIGVRVPCLLPGEWVIPPEAGDTAEGHLLEEDEEEDEVDERASMLEVEWRMREEDAERIRAMRTKGIGRISGETERNGSVGSCGGRYERGGIEEERDGDEGEAALDGGMSLAGGPRILPAPSSPPPRVVTLRKSTDSAGRDLPVAERAPVPAGLL
ncbi:hypothetical protein TI39_contig606g00006 [Zymoseptoria brevis]|uniref:PPPDE domain-containing protein n=1 Tax=Zymoseptoria brevis TaxID=1047168 RepID=A0A0F4GI20_9PEZI|nr:hypothetical protein TI39_contig606g00006 [Zymoseptoria brevis]